MTEHELEKIADGLGYSIWKCKKCGAERTRLMGRFLKWTRPECEVNGGK